MNKSLLYATTNKGKLWEVVKFLKPFGIKTVSLSDLGIDKDAPEEGSTLEENAKSKVNFYSQLAGDEYLVMADDTGIEIDALDGEPGIHVRRWKDGKTKISDQEIIDYCLKRLEGVLKEERGAQFRTVIALGTKKGIETFDGILRGIILEKPADVEPKKGFPFRVLFYATEWNKLLADVHDMDNKKKKKYLSHREKAVKSALPRIKELLSK